MAFGFLTLYIDNRGGAIVKVPGSELLNGWRETKDCQIQPNEGGMKKATYGSPFVVC